MSKLPAAVCLMGPTASGKTGLALELVKRLPMQIVSVDSALVYRDMNIGTAKPSADELAQAPHRLLDLVDPAESYSAARFRDEALREMRDISAAGDIPLLVGGTMLYFKALIEGIADLPDADEAIRKRLETEAKARGWPALHERLQAVDGASAARIQPTDPQRLQRALEVYELTGKPLSQWHAEQQAQQAEYRYLQFGIIPDDRAVLHRRIEQRFDQMLAEGFVDEVRGLKQRGDLHANLPAIRAVGYRQVWEYLDGQWTEGEMRHKGIVATRQLAKRQLTWLRGWPDLVELPMEQMCVDTVIARIQQWLS